MKTVLQALIAWCTLGMATVTYAQTEPVTVTSAGYQIKFLDAGLAKETGYEAFKMLLPPKDGFASNINVQHQIFPGTLKEYADMSTEQFKTTKMTLIRSELLENAFVAEASGKVANAKIDLRFYFRAIKVGDNVVLATACTPLDRWESEKGLLVPVIESLQATTPSP